MKSCYSSDVAKELVRWAKVENSHKKAIKIIEVADRVDTRWLQFADGDLARWKSQKFEEVIP